MERVKRLNALLYAMEEYPDIGRTKLMKFVFFTDLIHYNNYGNTLLDDEYIRMKAGPVPAHAFEVSGATQPQYDVCVEQIDEERTKYTYHPKQQCNRSLFSDEERELFDKIIRLLKAYHTEEISEITHRMALWKNHGKMDQIPIEEFELSDYEMDEFCSFIDYQEAIECVCQLEMNMDDGYEDRVPEYIHELQMAALKEE
ncbi:putative phage-associated protein [Methanoculleus chikugoensis]|uniref:Putative phage-associated protein n=1 Tax=Methanoculleus chikugoensis TaxID=118126 RepID=A0A1M4MLM3_9EURY|nr:MULTISPECIES: Panacea domain-containing protein [Methanoculleus]SCL75834.1 putative phage-associated protein [Methanoculleus chikugoensis]